MNENSSQPIIHAGKYLPPKSGWKTVFLKKISSERYVWFHHEKTGDQETEFEASTIEEALQLAYKKWKLLSFRTFHCGFLYTLPERDEHGTNALFYEMVASYRTANGIFLDETKGHMCFVQNASKEALNLWKSIAS